MSNLVYMPGTEPISPEIAATAAYAARKKVEREVVGRLEAAKLGEIPVIQMGTPEAKGVVLRSDGSGFELAAALRERATQGPVAVDMGHGDRTAVASMRDGKLLAIDELVHMSPAESEAAFKQLTLPDADEGPSDEEIRALIHRSGGKVSGPSKAPTVHDGRARNPFAEARKRRETVIGPGGMNMLAYCVKVGVVNLMTGLAYWPDTPTPLPRTGYRAAMRLAMAARATP